MQRSDAELASSTGRTAASAHKGGDFGAGRLQDSILKSRATAFVGKLWGGAGSLGGSKGTLTEHQLRAWGELANESVQRAPTFEVNLVKPVERREDD